MKIVLLSVAMLSLLACHNCPSAYQIDEAFDVTEDQVQLEIEASNGLTRDELECADVCRRVYSGSDDGSELMEVQSCTLSLGTAGTGSEVVGTVRCVGEASVICD